MNVVSSNADHHKRVTAILSLALLLDTTYSRRIIDKWKRSRNDDNSMQRIESSHFLIHDSWRPTQRESERRRGRREIERQRERSILATASDNKVSYQHYIECPQFCRPLHLIWFALPVNNNSWHKSTGPISANSSFCFDKSDQHKTYADECVIIVKTVYICMWYSEQ